MKNHSAVISEPPANFGWTLHKAKFAKAMQFAAHLKFLLCFIYRNPMPHVYPSHALRHIIKHVMTDRYPDLYIDYSKMLLSCGEVEPASLFAAVAEPGRIKFTWRDNSGEGAASEDDKVFLVAYCEALDALRFSVFKHKSSDCRGILEVPDFSGHEVHTWLVMKRVDDSAVANSVYTGKVRMM